MFFTHRAFDRTDSRGHTTITDGSNLFGPKSSFQPPKINASFKGYTPDRTPQVGFCGCCLIGAIGMSFSDKSMNFGSQKSWNVGFNHEKAFYPLRKFFTPFWHLMLQIVFSNSSIFLIFMRSKGEKTFCWGKKLFHLKICNFKFYLNQKLDLQYISKIDRKPIIRKRVIFGNLVELHAFFFWFR